jgi:hypothetical protein
MGLWPPKKRRRKRKVSASRGGVSVAIKCLAVQVVNLVRRTSGAHCRLHCAAV